MSITSNTWLAVNKFSNQWERFRGELTQGEGAARVGEWEEVAGDRRSHRSFSCSTLMERGGVATPSWRRGGAAAGCWPVEYRMGSRRSRLGAAASFVARRHAGLATAEAGGGAEVGKKGKE